MSLRPTPRRRPRVQRVRDGRPASSRALRRARAGLRRARGRRRLDRRHRASARARGRRRVLRHAVQPRHRRRGPDRLRLRARERLRLHGPGRRRRPARRRARSRRSMAAMDADPAIDMVCGSRFLDRRAELPGADQPAHRHPRLRVPALAHRRPARDRPDVGLPPLQPPRDRRSSRATTRTTTPRSRRC